MNSVDLVVILIVVGFIIVGGMRGLINSAIGLLGYILSIFLAFKLSPVLANFMVEKWQIDEKVNSVIISFIPKIAENMVNNNAKYKSMMDATGVGVDAIKDTLANTHLPFMDTITARIILIATARNPSKIFRRQEIYIGENSC